MKMAYVQWNKDSVTDESILADLYAMSGGELKAEEGINLNRVEYRPAPQNNNNNNNRGRTNNNQNNRGGSGGSAAGRTNNNPRNNNNQNNRNQNNRGGSGGPRKY
jgi:hypothetical protein